MGKTYSRALEKSNAILTEHCRKSHALILIITLIISFTGNFFLLLLSGRASLSLFPLGAHLREEQHILYRSLVGQQHA